VQDAARSLELMHDALDLSDVASDIERPTPVKNPSARSKIKLASLAGTFTSQLWTLSRNASR
jgi:hypothetical protein